MSNKKIKVFLGAFINSTNAQNLNCLAIAQYLNKEQFEIYALEVYSGNLASQKGKQPNVHIFNCFKPFKISKYIGFLWGIWYCDIAYLPKAEMNTWVGFCLKVLGKKSFSTVEGIYDKEALKSAIKIYGNYKNLIKSFKSYNRLYSITKFLKDYNEQEHSILTDEKILYLGTHTETFLEEKPHVFQLRNIVIIGSDLIRKGVHDYFKIAKNFPSLNFYIVGSGIGKIDVNALIAKEQLENITHLGTLSSKKLSKVLKTIDLHILPSRSEGFPKVTLETAAAGVPSLVYGDYGANEWITNNHNGFVVDTLEQMIDTVKQLKEEPEVLQRNSRNAVALAKSFDWNVLIKDWEQEILKLYHS